MERRQEEDIKHVEEEEDDKTEPGVILSQTRVKRIIKSDPDTKQIANNAAYLIGRATVRDTINGDWNLACIPPATFLLPLRLQSD